MNFHHKRMNHSYVFAAFLAVILLWEPVRVPAAQVSQTDTADDQEKRVLFLSSYSYAWDTVQIEIEGIKEIFLKEMAKGDTFTDMEPEGIIAIQKCLKLIDKSSELMKEYVEVLESQDNKLDRILEKLEARG